MKPSVSIIVPVYNAEACLSRCVESVLNQEYESFELLLADDGSRDGSGSICDAFAAAVDYAYQRYDLIPVFIPIEGKPDAAAAQKVAAQLRYAPANLLPSCPSSELAIALSARMDVALSMRLHALIFAAVRGVPLVGVVYDPKVSAFLDDAGQDLYARLDQVTPELLCALLDDAARRRQDGQALADKTTRLIQLEHRNSEAAAKLLTGWTRR